MWSAGAERERGGSGCVVGCQREGHLFWLRRVASPTTCTPSRQAASRAHLLVVPHGHAFGSYQACKRCQAACPFTLVRSGAWLARAHVVQLVARPPDPEQIGAGRGVQRDSDIGFDTAEKSGTSFLQHKESVENFDQDASRAKT